MNKTVLLVDDDESFLKVLALSLARNGYQVFSATNGADAIEAVLESEIAIDIVDLIMEDMDGIHILRQIKDQRPDTRVIISTAYGDLESAVEALRFRADDYLIKPYEISELDFRISNCFR